MRGDSVVDNTIVNDFRKQLGQKIVKQLLDKREENVDLNFSIGQSWIDKKAIICGVPKSGIIYGESISDELGLEYQQFISYTDKDTKIYGFDVLSLHNLVSKGSGPVKNPYNRNEIPQELLDNMKFVFNFSHIYFKKIEIVIEPPVVQDSMKVLELECIALFQEINALGNYAEHTWLWSLSKNKLTKFINYIADIWAYRANLTNEMKRNICPPNGDPFAGLSLYYIRTMELLILRKTCLSIIRSIVLKSSDRGDRTLGANYVLCAITLVNTEAAISLPWLYQSVAYY